MDIDNSPSMRLARVAATAFIHHAGLQDKEIRKMPSQLFKVTRAPEARPVSAQTIRQAVTQRRIDSEWEVEEVELYEGHVMSTKVAGFKRKQANDA